MHEPMSQPKVAGRVWVVLKRILAAIVILVATITFLGNAAGLVGIWVVRQPVRDTVMALATSVDEKLGKVDEALARLSARADEARQALARVNDAASKLGDRVEDGSPLRTALTGAYDDLVPEIAEIRAQAAALHDGVVSVNAALETLDSLGYINVPTFTNELSAVAEWVDAVQVDLQELRASIDQAKTAASANFVAAVTTRTTKIDNVMAQIKATTVKYQATVAQKRQQVIELSRRVLRVINLLVLSLSVLFIVVGVAQVLLTYVCWQYVRRGRSPLGRVDSQRDVWLQHL
jgi:predicted  nucleic acid-binding Zn-ribbon protein